MLQVREGEAEREEEGWHLEHEGRGSFDVRILKIGQTDRMAPNLIGIRE